MTKRPRKLPTQPIHERLAEIGARAVAAQDEPQPIPYQRRQQSLPLSLDDIRRQALVDRANIAHTIADLEAWAAEIASTIAFLKSNR